MRNYCQCLQQLNVDTDRETMVEVQVVVRTEAGTAIVGRGCIKTSLVSKTGLLASQGLHGIAGQTLSRLHHRALHMSPTSPVPNHYGQRPEGGQNLLDTTRRDGGQYCSSIVSTPHHLPNLPETPKLTFTVLEVEILSSRIMVINKQRVSAGTSGHRGLYSPVYSPRAYNVRPRQLP